MTGKYHLGKLQRVKTDHLGHEWEQDAATKCRQHKVTTFHPIHMLLLVHPAPTCCAQDG